MANTEPLQEGGLRKLLDSAKRAVAVVAPIMTRGPQFILGIELRSFGQAYSFRYFFDPSLFYADARTTVKPRKKSHVQM